MVRGLIAAIMVGVVCALVGTYVVLRGMAFLRRRAGPCHPARRGRRLPDQRRRSRLLFGWALLTAVLAALGIGAISKGAQSKKTPPSASSL
jgi:manganese/iron transport system permease protein